MCGPGGSWFNKFVHRELTSVGEAGGAQVGTPAGGQRRVRSGMNARYRKDLAELREKEEDGRSSWVSKGAGGAARSAKRQEQVSQVQAAAPRARCAREAARMCSKCGHW